MIGPCSFDYQSFPAQGEKRIIWVDGGINHKEKINLSPDTKSIIVGDQDSANPQSHQLFDHILSTQKDFSDLSFALSLIACTTQEVFSWGFMGERLDHQMANFGEVHQFLKKKTGARFYWDQRAISFSSGEHRLTLHSSFSLFSFGGGSVKLTGDVLYPIDSHRSLEVFSSLGLSNQANGELALEIIDTTCLILINNNED